jgi:hypothetical protein
MRACLARMCTALLSWNSSCRTGSRASDTPTVGDIGAFGGSPVITVTMDTDEFVLNGDSKRAAVMAFLAAAERAGGAENLGWRVTANSKGDAQQSELPPGRRPGTGMVRLSPRACTPTADAETTTAWNTLNIEKFAIPQPSRPNQGTHLHPADPRDQSRVMRGTGCAGGLGAAAGCGR